MSRAVKNNSEVLIMQMRPVRVTISEVISSMTLHVSNSVEGGAGGESQREYDDNDKEDSE